MTSSFNDDDNLYAMRMGLHLIHPCMYIKFGFDTFFTRRNVAGNNIKHVLKFNMLINKII
jgi:hypothetical protein